MINFKIFKLTNKILPTLGFPNLFLAVIDIFLIFNFENLLPIIEPIGNLTAYIGQEFTYVIKATNPADNFMVLLDDTSLFDINTQTGEIKLTPTLKGNYSIKITAVNSEGHVFEFMRLEVK